MDSIKQVGLLQPIGVVKRENNKYNILFGNRRLISIRKLGYSEIDAVIFDDMNEREFMIVNLIENLQRQDISAQEKAKVLLELKAQGLTESEIASRLSISVTTVKNILELYRVPKNLRNRIVNMPAGKTYKKGKVPQTVANYIMRVDKEFRLGAVNLELLFNYAASDESSLDRIRIIASLLKNKISLKDAIQKVNEISVVRVNVPVNKEDMNNLQKKYKLSKNDIVINILSGKIKETISW